MIKFDGSFARTGCPSLSSVNTFDRCVWERVLFNPNTVLELAAFSTVQNLVHTF